MPPTGGINNGTILRLFGKSFGFKAEYTWGMTNFCCPFLEG